MKKLIKMLFIPAILICLLFSLSDVTLAKRGSRGYKSSSSGSKTVQVKSYYRKNGTFVPSHTRSYSKSKSEVTSKKSSNSYSPSSSNGIARDSKGHIKRSSSARKDFMKQTGYPNGRPGYIIDHIVALKRGGADSPENMQWQTIEEAKIKDKVE